MTIRIRSRVTASMYLMASVSLITLAACGSSTTKAAPTTTAAATTTAPAAAPTTTAPAAAPTTAAAAAGTNSLTIKNFSFGALTVKAGDTIALVNADPADHTVTADNGTFDIAAAAGKTTNLVIAKAGTYAIHCKIHSSMHGTITVT